MAMKSVLNGGLVLGLVLVLSACGGGSFLRGNSELARQTSADVVRQERIETTGSADSIWDLFTGQNDPSTAVTVNRYLWRASLEVLDFLPIETVDPFTGVFTTGFATPPGGGRPYRATVHVTDAALDARSLNVALMTRAGPASAATVQAVENAILTRARQLRIRDRNL
jgi:hypothetical protein